MFTKKEIKNLSKELVDFFKKFKYVDMLCIHGSRNAGRARKDSDLDYYILFRGDYKKIVPGLFNLIDKKTSLDKKDYYLKKYVDFCGGHFALTGRKVSIHMLETDVFENALKSVFKSEDNFKKSQGFVRGWILEATPLYDTKKLFKKFKRYVKFDIRFRKDLLNKKIKSLKTLLAYVKKSISKGTFVFYDELDIVIRLIVDILYLKNKSFQIPHYKTLDKDIKKFKPNIERELRYVMEKPNEGVYMKKKMDMMVRIVKKL